MNTYNGDILYPPEPVFPRNPNLCQWIVPQTVIETYKEDNSELKFQLGLTGQLNVIKTVYAPYLDRKYYNFKEKKWIINQIKFEISGNINVIDITAYFTNSIINFSGNATGIMDTIYYYFDGSKIITNYDFTNPEDKKRVTITYKKLLNSLRVKAVLKTNNSSLSCYTPVIDQYTLLVDKQRVLN